MSTTEDSSTASLVMPLKLPIRLDLVEPLAQWLDNTSANEDPTTSSSIKAPPFTSIDCRSELLRVAALRNSLAEDLQDSHVHAIESNSLEDCQDYYATLVAFEKQGFPTSLRDAHTSTSTNGIFLTWRGAMDLEELETQYALDMDKAGALWNAAALLIFQAQTQSRDWESKESCKAALPFLQQAAGLLRELKALIVDGGKSKGDETKQSSAYKDDGYYDSYYNNDNDDDDSTVDPIRTVDYSKAMLTFWERLCLGQAQYGIYKLANHGSVRQHSTLAYLVQSAASYYNEALAEATTAPRLVSEVDSSIRKKWATHCKAQSLQCQARASFHLSIAHRLEKEHGLELARLQECLAKLKECLAFEQQAASSQQQQQEQEQERKKKKKNSSSTTTTMPPSTTKTSGPLQSLHQLVSDRYRQAQEDNAHIYNERVPSVLAEIRPQSMVNSNNQSLPQAMLEPRVPLFQWRQEH